VRSTPLMESWVAGNPAFVTRPVGSSNVYKEFVWGDVLKGIEEISHNVTAALLTLPLGTMNSTCSFDLQDVVYQYSSTAFWVPYGVSTFSLLSFHDLTLSPLCFIDVTGRCSNFAHFAVMIMGRNNTGHITKSFSDTAILARNMDEEVSAGANLRLRAAEDRKIEYILEETNGASE